MSQDIRSLIASDKFKEQCSAALPKHLTADRFARVALTALTRNPKLQDCTRESLLRCLMDCSALGIEPDGRRAHLIPYKDQCTLIIDYKGLIELVRRSGDVAAIRAETVCENDGFDWENGTITHRIDWRKSRGEVQAVYAEAKLASGETQTAVMTLDEVNGIRDRSQGYTYARNNKKSHPWITDWGEMAKKTALRRLIKLLPLSVEIADAVERDDDRVERDVTPAPAKLPPVSQVAGLFAPPSSDHPDMLPLDELRFRLASRGIDAEKATEYLRSQAVTEAATFDDIADDEARAALNGFGHLVSALSQYTEAP
jgi:recombination protein RecT